jgi:hypothetical protein
MYLQLPGQLVPPAERKEVAIPTVPRVAVGEVGEEFLTLMRLKVTL